MSKEPLPDWFRFHIAAYDKATGHLNVTQHGAYFLLIKHYYSRGVLPTDDHQLASICKMSMHQWKANRAVIASFFTEDWKQEKCEEELGFYREKAKVRAKAGALGGAAKAARSAPPPREAPQNFFDKAPAKTEEAFDAKPLKSKEPPLANATQFATRVQSLESKKESSSDSLAREPDPPAAAARPTDDDDKAFKSKVREALGPKTAEAVASAVVPTLRVLIADGCDFERDVLPKLRDIATSGLKTPAPAFLGQQIRERRDARVAAAAARGAAPAAPQVFVAADTPQWRAWAIHTGRRWPTSARNGTGWYFASEWPPGSEPDDEQPPAPAAPRFKLPDMAAMLAHMNADQPGRLAR